MEKFKLYKVGGCVRDTLLGLKSKDIDYSFIFEEIDTAITPDEYFIKMKNILVFPCGSEIALEIYKSLEFSTHFTLFGASSVKDHGEFIYKNYILLILLKSLPYGESYKLRYNYVKV